MAPSLIVLSAVLLSLAAGSPAPPAPAAVIPGPFAPHSSSQSGSTASHRADLSLAPSRHGLTLSKPIKADDGDDDDDGDDGDDSAGSVQRFIPL